MWFTTFDSNLLISAVLGLQKVQHCFKNFSTPEKIMQEKSLYCWKKIVIWLNMIGFFLSKFPVMHCFFSVPKLS